MPSNSGIKEYNNKEDNDNNNLIFYITTNLVVRCIPGREGGVILTATTKKMRMPGKRGQGQCGRMRDEGLQVKLG